MSAKEINIVRDDRIGSLVPSVNAGQLLTAHVPSKISEIEFSALGRDIYKQIIELTGCPCLSGTLRVVLEEKFARVINVRLDAPAELKSE